MTKRCVNARFRSTFQGASSGAGAATAREVDVDIDELLDMDGDELRRTHLTVPPPQYDCSYLPLPPALSPNMGRPTSLYYNGIVPLLLRTLK